MKKLLLWISLLSMTAILFTGCGASGDTKDVQSDVNTEEDADVESDVDVEEGALVVEGADLSKFAGDWYVDGSLENGHLSIDENGHVESYSYDGLFNFEGELVCEEYENPDGTTGYLYNIYDDGGEFVIGFYEPEEEDFYELYSGQDGEVHYVRSDHCTQGPSTDNASSEGEVGEISCDIIAGDWDYQVADPDDIEKFTPNGEINIADDASYTYISLDGNTGKGNVRVEYEEYADGSKLPMFNFYEEGDSFWIGTYYDENEPDTLWIGNGGEERLVRKGQ